ncbi:hypothetical protein PHMEG_0005523 [Phytophthora megakarya]|uniref:Uncharacterized protein n=1 Tax=Phytophthora megakarya TaxID=4795 RepID=A0A225WR65_9STRA|nr:hypothetical protein PHMEG_0005523 [Phytophthora megakarya]
MDLSDIPFDVAVILYSTEGNNLRNPVGSKKASCLAENNDVYEQLVLRRINDKVAIQSARNDRFLQVRANGDCVFDAKEVSEQNLFTLESNSTGALIFISCFNGNALGCDDENLVKCASKDGEEEDGEEAWIIVEPAIRGAQLTSQHHVLAGRERQQFILELAKAGKTVDEIEQIVTRLFDEPAVATPSSAVFSLDKEEEN